jgi:hypothetical protein
MQECRTINIIQKYEWVLSPSEYRLDIYSKPSPSDYPNIPTKGGIYFLFDDEQNLLYVGQTRNLRIRLIEHFTDGNLRLKMPRKFCHYAFQIEESYEKRLVIEKYCIRLYTPEYNNKNILNGYVPSESEMRELATKKGFA